MAISSTLCGALLVENGQRHDASAAFVNQQWLWFNGAVAATSLAGRRTDRDLLARRRACMSPH